LKIGDSAKELSVLKAATSTSYAFSDSPNAMYASINLIFACNQQMHFALEMKTFAASFHDSDEPSHQDF
jgi:hypothetical protein